MDTLYRQWLILRMIPRRGKIATTEILSRLKSQHSVETTLRTVQRDLTICPAFSSLNAMSTGRPAGSGRKKRRFWRWPTWTR